MNLALAGALDGRIVNIGDEAPTSIYELIVLVGGTMEPSSAPLANPLAPPDGCLACSQPWFSAGRADGLSGRAGKHDVGCAPGAGDGVPAGYPAPNKRPRRYFCASIRRGCSKQTLQRATSSIARVYAALEQCGTGVFVCAERCWFSDVTGWRQRRTSGNIRG